MKSQTKQKSRSRKCLAAIKLRIFCVIAKCRPTSLSELRGKDFKFYWCSLCLAILVHAAQWTQSGSMGHFTLNKDLSQGAGIASWAGSIAHVLSRINPCQVVKNQRAGTIRIFNDDVMRVHLHRLPIFKVKQRKHSFSFYDQSVLFRVEKPSN